VASALSAPPQRDMWTFGGKALTNAEIGAAVAGAN
jgi:hypothetical protein